MTTKKVRVPSVRFPSYPEPSTPEARDAILLAHLRELHMGDALRIHRERYDRRRQNMDALFSEYTANNRTVQGAHMAPGTAAAYAALPEAGSPEQAEQALYSARATWAAEDAAKSKAAAVKRAVAREQELQEELERVRREAENTMANLSDLDRQVMAETEIEDESEAAE